MVISAVQLLSELPASPWKNGGGSTRTLAIEPKGAGTDDFLWRVSLAEVAVPGDFSLFPGVDRTILLWSGKGLELRGPGWSHRLDQRLLPFEFSGEDEIACDLISGPTDDLNVMVRRGVASAELQVGRDVMKLACPSDATIVLCAGGNVQLDAGGYPTMSLAANEFAVIEGRQTATVVEPLSDDAVFVVISLARIHPDSCA